MEEIYYGTSQLYEATTEGLLLCMILLVIVYKFYKEGRVFSTLLLDMESFNFFIEFTRQPDEHLGLLALELSMGQWLSITMIILGGYGHMQSLKTYYVESKHHIDIES